MNFEGCFANSSLYSFIDHTLEKKIEEFSEEDAKIPAKSCLHVEILPYSTANIQHPISFI